jgi:hypothetical protein
MKSKIAQKMQNKYNSYSFLGKVIFNVKMEIYILRALGLYNYFKLQRWEKIYKKKFYEK